LRGKIVENYDWKREKKMDDQYINEMLKGYCEAALWCDAIPLESDPGHPDHEENWESGGMDGTHHIDSASEAKMRSLIAEWVEENEALLFQYGEEMPITTWSIGERAGHDLRLTAGGHGAGFWDRGLQPDLGRSLTEAAKMFGDYTLWEVENGYCKFDIY
jgi:hypothetical protein